MGVMRCGQFWKMVFNMYYLIFIFVFVYLGIFFIWVVLMGMVIGNESRY